jgi:hypothetical protein
MLRDSFIYIDQFLISTEGFFVECKTYSRNVGIADVALIQIFAEVTQAGAAEKENI